MTSRHLLFLEFTARMSVSVSLSVCVCVSVCEKYSLPMRANFVAFRSYGTYLSYSLVSIVEDGINDE